MWQDRPNKDGWWWGNFGGATNIYLVLAGKAYLPGETWERATVLENMPEGYWQEVVPPRGEIPDA